MKVFFKEFSIHKLSSKKSLSIFVKNNNCLYKHFSTDCTTLAKKMSDKNKLVTVKNNKTEKDVVKTNGKPVVEENCVVKKVK